MCTFASSNQNERNMKKEKEIKVEMFRVEGDLNPFIEVYYVDKDAVEHTGFMMLDSGSNVNFLSNSADRYIGELCRYEDSELEITDCVGEVVIADNVHFSFAFGGKQFSEDFGIKKDYHLGTIDNVPIIGLLGNEFMQKHRLAIDYSTFTVHTSNVSHANLCSSDCEFMFPMEIGLKNYGVPALAIHHEDKDVAVIADTGSTANVVSTDCISQCHLNCEYTGENNALNGLKGRSDVVSANVRFQLLTLRANGTEGVLFHDSFFVINHPILEGYVCEQDCQPLEGLIGSPFMAKQGWVLDFAQKVIYKRKCQTF